MNYRVEMKNIRIIGLIVFILLLSGGAFLFKQGNSNDTSKNSINNKDNFKQALYVALAQNKSNHKEADSVKDEEDDTVIINVSNFGRSNPFKPYAEKSLYTTTTIVQPPPINVPKPPQFTPDPNYTSLFGIKVNGILYDSTRPSAIINVDNNDYLVHRGDFLFNFYVKDITPDKIAIKYQNNVYRAGIGEIIEGIVNINPVSRHRTASYSGSSGGTSSSNIRLSNPVTLPTLPILK